MEFISDILAFIDQHESLFSGIAALLAIVGVCAALLLELQKRLAGSGGSKESGTPAATLPALRQDIQYTRAAPGVRIAWSAVGEGTPLVRSLGWFTNLETEWAYPGSRACIEALARRYRFVRYDARGIGMSQRDVPEVSAATRLQDLEAVMDAAGVERGILLGLSEGGTTAIEYTARHPERVSHLVLWGTFLKQPADPVLRREWNALTGLIEKQWDSDSNRLLQMITAIFLPDGDATQNRFFNTMQRQSASAATVVRTLRSIGQVDVSALAATVTVPTLVIHRVGDLAIAVDLGREVAATIPGARLVQVDGANHWIHADLPAFTELLDEIDKFVGSPR